MCASASTKRTSRSGLGMSVDWGRPEVADGVTRRMLPRASPLRRPRSEEGAGNVRHRMRR